MLSRQQIEELVGKIVKIEGISHISDMLEGIQLYIMYKKPTSKFMQLCADENWEYASNVADRMNKEILTQSDLFQNFVKKIKTSPEYICKIRGEKLNDIGI